MSYIRKFFSNRFVEVITALLLTFILFITFGQFVGSIIMRYTVYLLGGDTWQFVCQYGMFIGLWIVAIAYIWITKKNRPMLQLLGSKPKGNNIKTALIWGIPLGFGLNMACAVVAMAFGDIHLSFNSFNPFMFLVFLLAVLVQSGAEELCCRLFLFQRIRKAFPKRLEVAIIINSLLFALAHAMNPGVTIMSLISVFCSGLMFTVMVAYLDSFWAAVVAHTTWNFTQSILLGLPNSGIVSAYSVFGLDAASARDGISYTVNFGIEGSVLSIILILAATVVVYIYGRRKNIQPMNIWDDK